MNIILFQNNLLILIPILLVHIILNTLIQNKITKQLLNLNIKELTRMYFLQIMIYFVVKLIFPLEISKVIEIIIQTILYKKMLMLRIEKVLFVQEVNVILTTLAEMISIKIFTEMYEINSLTNALQNINFLIVTAISIIIIEMLVYKIIKTYNVKVDMEEYLSNTSKIRIIEILSISILLIMVDEILIIKCINNIPTMIFILDIVLLISYYLINSFSISNTLKIEKDINIINELQSNNVRLQNNYDNICSFRHDFGNIMQGIGGYIKTKDIAGLEKMYNDVINECEEIKSIKVFNTDIINNPAIYNLINNKYLEAKKQDINIKLEVYLDLNTLNIKTYELCRILGVLIDNAIEACKECTDKYISIKFIKDNYNKRNLVIIENTCKNYLIDVKQLRKKGFTTKKSKKFHGLGLWRVNQIIKKNENLRLYTSRDKLFKQQLEIYTWK